MVNGTWNPTLDYDLEALWHTQIALAIGRDIMQAGAYTILPLYCSLVHL